MLKYRMKIMVQELAVIVPIIFASVLLSAFCYAVLEITGL